MFIWTQFIDQLPVGLLAQLVERCTGIAEVMGSNPVRAWNFFQVLFTTTRFSSVLSCEGLLISTAVQICEFSYSYKNLVLHRDKTLRLKNLSTLLQRMQILYYLAENTSKKFLVIRRLSFPHPTVKGGCCQGKGT